MIKKPYTYEDWLRDKPYFRPDSIVSDGPGVPDGLTLAEYNELIRNTAEYLYHDAKVISDEEYRKINRARLEAFNIVRLYYKQKIDGHLTKALSDVTDKRKSLSNRLNRIDTYLDDDNRSTILDDLTFGRIPPPQITGRRYSTIKESQNNNTAQSPLLEVGSRQSILQPVVDIPQGKRINQYLEVALLLDERQIIQNLLENSQNSGQRSDTKTIGDRRGENKKQQELVPSEEFFIEAKRLYNKFDDLTLSSRRPKHDSAGKRNASDWLIGMLFKKGYDFYERRDTDQVNPKKPSESTIKRLLNKNKSKWQVNEGPSH